MADKGKKIQKKAKLLALTASVVMGAASASAYSKTPATPIGEGFKLREQMLNQYASKLENSEKAASKSQSKKREGKSKEGKCGEGKCGDKKDKGAKRAKSKEGKCGQGKCGS